MNSVMESFVELFRTARELLQGVGVAAVLDGVGDGIDAEGENAEHDALSRGGRALLVGVFEGLGAIANRIGLAIGGGLLE